MKPHEMLLEQVLTMAHSPVKNYAIPGLTSWLIGDNLNGGCVRLFHSEREHVEPITPHSHRFNFTAQVLKGGVTNRMWREATDSTGDLYCVSAQKYLGTSGQYETKVEATRYYRYYDRDYKAGDTYQTMAEEIHSIYFDRDTYVLMFEGPSVTNTSDILEPMVDGHRIPTFKVEPWMFQRQ